MRNTDLVEPGDKGGTAQPALRRVLGTSLLTLYGLGVIIGAGIYVLIGTVVDAAGGGAPWSFVLAGILAGLTGLCYAELAVRFPEAAGAAGRDGRGDHTLPRRGGARRPAARLTLLTAHHAAVERLHRARVGRIELADLLDGAGRHGAGC